VTGWARRTARRLVDAIRWAQGRDDVRPGTTAFRYGNSATTFLWVITAMTAVETAIVEVAVPWLWLRVVLAVVCIGSLPLMAGMVADYRLRPHLLGERTVLLRCGSAIEVEVPLSAIASVGRTIGTAPRHPGVVGSALELGVGTTDIVIALRSAQSDGAETDARSFDHIRCSADDPAAFAASVRAAITSPTRA
jgi:hypothetical protein